MGKLIAQMLGKTELPLADDGRVTLTAEERARRSEYLRGRVHPHVGGDRFLDR